MTVIQFPTQPRNQRGETDEQETEQFLRDVEEANKKRKEKLAAERIAECRDLVRRWKLRRPGK